MNKFSENLKKIRLERNISVKEMAKGVGVSPSTIINWEKNAKRVRIFYLISIVDFLKISCDELLGVDKKTRK